MKFGPTRGNPLYIFDHFIKDFGLLLVAIIVAIFSGPQAITNNIYVLVIIVLSPIQRCFSYFTTVYSIDDTKLLVESGFFTKKRTEIPLETITTVDFAQSLVYQLFGVYGLKIDNGSQAKEFAQKAEVSLALKKEQANQVKKLLLARKTSDVETDLESRLLDEVEILPVAKASMMDFFLLGLLQTKVAYVVSLSAPAFAVASFLLMKLGGFKNGDAVMNHYMDSLGPVLSVSLMVLYIYLISVLSSILMTVVKYYNFRISDKGNSLYIEFGLFTKKTYTLMKEKISGMAVNQSFLMRLSGYATVDVFVIGYGNSSNDEGKELAMLFPLIKYNRLSEFLSELIPDISVHNNYQMVNRKAIRYFFWCPRIFFTVILLVGVCFTKMWWIILGALLLLVVAIISVVLEYRETGYYVNRNTVSFSSGGFKRKRVYVKTEKIESVTEKSFLMKRNKGYTSVTLGFMAPLLYSHTRLKNVTFEDYKTVWSILEY